MSSAARRAPEPTWRRELRAPARLDSLPSIGASLHEFAREAFGQGGDSSAVHDLRLAVQEAVTNVIEHGQIPDPDLGIVLEARGSTLVVEVRSRGVCFDTTRVNPLLPDLELLAEGGYGICLMHALVDEMEFTTEGDTNVLVLSKSIPVTP